MSHVILWVGATHYVSPPYQVWWSQGPKIKPSKFPPEESKETNNESKMTTLNNCEISRLNYTRFEFEIVMFSFLCHSLSNSRRHSANADVKNKIIV